jgi:hypothetical protein
MRFFLVIVLVLAVVTNAQNHGDSMLARSFLDALGARYEDFITALTVHRDSGAGLSSIQLSWQYSLKPRGCPYANILKVVANIAIAGLCTLAGRKLLVDFLRPHPGEF